MEGPGWREEDERHVFLQREGTVCARVEIDVEVVNGEGFVDDGGIVAVKLFLVLFHAVESKRA